MIRIAIAQVAPKLARVDENLPLHLELIDRARQERADLLVFPELSLTGYHLRDLVPEVAQPRESPILSELGQAANQLVLVAGFVEESPEHCFYNAAGLFWGGQLRAVHRKVYLPTYGLFDEQRYFAAGDRILAFETPLGRLGILICEDVWHLSSAVLLQALKVDYVVMVSNSPGRGVRGGRFDSEQVWRLLVRCYALCLGAAVVFANRAGCEEGITFWGGSEVVGPEGETLGSAEKIDEDFLVVEFDPKTIRTARIRTPLGRDEKLWLTHLELTRIVEGLYGTGWPALRLDEKANGK
jgi:N-carbamoylputrescine amidase